MYRRHKFVMMTTSIAAMILAIAIVLLKFLLLRCGIQQQSLSFCLVFLL